MGTQFDTEDWVEFLTGIGPGQLSPHGEVLRDQFEAQIDKLMDQFDPDGHIMYDTTDTAYLAFGSLMGHGVGLHEEDEEWHGPFETFLQDAPAGSDQRQLFVIGEELENEARDSGPPDDDTLAESVTITDDGEVIYAGELLGDFETLEDAYAAISAKSTAEGYFPDVYLINERGNITLVDALGNEVQSWV